MNKWFIDDRLIIPDEIKKMSPEELSAEIERLEKERFLKENPEFNAKE